MSSGRARGAVPDVLPDRRREQQRVLGDADLGSRTPGVVGQVVTVHRDPSRLRVVEPQEEVGDGGLPVAGAADDGDPLAGRRLERHAPQDRAVGLVGEPDPLEPHLSAQARRGHGVGGSP